MKKIIKTFLILFPAINCFGQIYNKEKVCETDTINVAYRDLKLGEPVSYKAFECTQVAKAGLRIDLGYTTFSYNTSVKKWIGSPAGLLFGLIFTHDKLNIGAKFKLVTTSPKSILVFNGDSLLHDAKLNPIKMDLFTGYSFDLKNNFSVEPYAAITRNIFFVINEEELGKSFDIPTVGGLTLGVTLNRYFSLKDFQFLSAFVSGAYGFSNFKKVHPSLGVGYSEFAIGLSYKFFGKRRFYDKLN